VGFIEQFIVDNSGQLAQGGIGGGIMIWCILKIKQQCLILSKLTRSKVEKELCESRHDALEKSVDEMKADNKEDHRLIFAELKDVKDLIISKL